MAAPTVTGLVPGVDSVRVNFSKDMYRGGNYTNPEIYTFVDVESGAVDVAVESVTPGVNYVILNVEGFTDGKTYKIHIPGNTIRSTVIEYLDWLAEVTTVNFTAQSDNPQIIGVTATSATEVIVTFSKPMVKNADIENPSNYAWTGGIVTLKAEYKTEYTVLLTTSEQTPGIAYDLQV